MNVFAFDLELPIGAHHHQPYMPSGHGHPPWLLHHRRDPPESLRQLWDPQLDSEERAG